MVGKTLSQLGLNNNEIKIYLALLPMQNSCASVLGMRTDIERTAARYTCKQLVKKGLVLETKKGNTFIYQAEPIDRILHLLDEKKEDLQQKEEQACRILSQLKALADPQTSLPKTRFYEGLNGIKDIYEDTLKEQEPIYAFQNINRMAPDVKNHLAESKYVPRRAEKGIFAQVITPKDETHESVRKIDKDRFRETRFLSENTFPMEVEINIYGHKTAFISYDRAEMFGTIIDSPAITNSMKAVFDICWKKAR